MFDTNEDLYRWLQRVKDKEEKAGEPMFMGIPDRWFENPTWRCRNGHVSKRYLKSEDCGDLCLACYERVRMTFPEDTEE